MRKLAATVATLGLATGLTLAGSGTALAQDVCAAEDAVNVLTCVDVTDVLDLDLSEGLDLGGLTD